MSNLFTTPWTTAEKIALLTNIIQGVVQDVPAFLVQAILDSNIQPKWNDIALPEGRSVHACQYVYEEMQRSVRPRSFSSVGYPGFLPQTLGPNMSHVRAASENEPPPPTQRALQPRPPRSTDSPLPPATNGEAFTILRPFAPELGVERRRKRGRPTKEEAEERDRRLAAAGQTYEPKKRPAKKPRPSGTPGSLSEAFPGTSPSAQTPRLLHTEPMEETSSGKRRSKRQREEEHEEPSHQAPLRYASEGSGNERSDVAQSPSDRLLLQRSNERAQAVASVAQEVRKSFSPNMPPNTESRQDDQQSGGTPSA